MKRGLLGACGVLFAAVVATGCSVGAAMRTIGIYGPISEACRTEIDAVQAGLDKSALVVTVYLADAVTASEVVRLRSELLSIDGVGGEEMVTKREALQQAKELFAESPGVMENLPGNPFPASIKVTLESPRAAGRVEAAIEDHPGVDDVARGGVKSQAIVDTARTGVLGPACPDAFR